MYGIKYWIRKSDAMRAYYVTEIINNIPYRSMVISRGEGIKIITIDKKKLQSLVGFS